MNFPRVLVVALGRINAADTANNGLLLRNLFGAWPRENLAQIYSSGDNGDEGFFGRYYRLGPGDRRLGRWFYKMKANAQAKVASETLAPVSQSSVPNKVTSFKALLKALLVDSGLYELIFQPRLSREILAWVEDFKPDIIFSQGYCLTFAWLPVMLSKHSNLPIAYYPTDDWPTDTYRHNNSHTLLTQFVNAVVKFSSRRLVEKSIVRLAFNRYMQDEYRYRYHKEFEVLMHGDDVCRYHAVQPQRLAGDNECWVVSTGYFNQQRWSLLYDLDEACEILSKRGYLIRATVFPVNHLSDIEKGSNNFRHIQFQTCPTHDGLVSFLRGADILFLPERFDEHAGGIRLSVSSKAHLFMFSEKPTVVYSDPITGIARYAQDEKWAAVVDRRDSYELAKTFKKLIDDTTYRNTIIAYAKKTALENHQLTTIQHNFLALIVSALHT